MLALPQQLDSPVEPWQAASAVAMSQVDNRVATGQKRARSEGPRGEGDWTCPFCGNVNFAFRSTCNMRKCGASKPADVAQRGVVGGPMPSPYDPPPPAMYMAGPGVAPPMPMGMNGGYAPMPMPPPVSGVPYEYGAMNLPGTYSPIPMPGPGSIIGAGPGYAPMLDGYAMSMAMVRGPPFPLVQLPGPRPGIHIEENGSRKRRGGPEGSSEGDWLCPKCGNSNFAFRTFCNMRKCGTPKPAEPVCTSSTLAGMSWQSADGIASTQVPRPVPQKSSSQGPPPEGSWTCEACGNVNYPFRTKCNRRNCGADKPADAKLAPKSPPSD